MNYTTIPYQRHNHHPHPYVNTNTNNLQTTTITSNNPYKMLLLVVGAVKFDYSRCALLKCILAGRDSSGIGWILVLVVMIDWNWW